MKSKYHKLIVLLWLSVCFMGCQEEKIVYPEPDEEVAATYLDLEQLTEWTIEVEGAEGNHLLKVRSDEKWTLSSSEDWCSVSDQEGFRYSQISVSYSDNPWNEPRSAELIFTMNETQVEKRIAVEQKASETTLSTDVAELPYNIGGGEKSVELQTNAVEWSVQLTDDATGAAATWCTVTPAAGKGTGTLKITAESNGTNVLRTAKLVFTAADKSLTIPVIQAEKLEAPVVRLEDSDSFELVWEEITGVDGYRLKYTASGQEQSIDIASGASSYDLNLIGWNGYVGVISVQLFSYAYVGEGATSEMGSEVISVHNLFDDTSGNGEESAPYIVSKPRHLRNVSKCPDKHYKQINDIDLTGIDFAPISTELVNNAYVGNFTGVYDAGKGTIIDADTKRSSGQYKIMNWTLSKGTNSNCGLFAFVGEEGIVRNVCIENAVIMGKARVGAVAGNCTGQIISCHTTGTTASLTTATTTDTEVYLGGVVGYLSEKGEVSYCSNTAAIVGSAGCIGGVVGMVMSDENNAPVISYCTNNGEVVSNNRSPVGGVVGSIAGTATAPAVQVTGCVNTGKVSGEQTNNQVGGVVGRANVNTRISQSYNTGAVTATGSAGGIIGRMGGNTALIADCYNTGFIKSTGTATNGNNNAAGILATCTTVAAGTMTIENCHNVGGLETANGEAFYNGIFHRTDGKLAKINMQNCFALNETGKSQNSGSDSFLSGGSSSYRNLSAANMKNAASFSSWDFSTIWTMGSEYPVLQVFSK